MRQYKRYIWYSINKSFTSCSTIYPTVSHDYRAPSYRMSIKEEGVVLSLLLTHNAGQLQHWQNMMLVWFSSCEPLISGCCPTSNFGNLRMEKTSKLSAEDDLSRSDGRCKTEGNMKKRSCCRSCGPPGVQMETNHTLAKYLISLVQQKTNHFSQWIYFVLKKITWKLEFSLCFLKKKTSLLHGTAVAIIKDANKHWVYKVRHIQNTILPYSQYK